MLLLQAVCGIALVGLVSVGILGLVFGAAVGRRCAWCPSAACVDTRWWACQSTEQPICNYSPTGNGTASIECTGVRPSSSSSADAAAAGGRVHWGRAAEQALLCIRHGIPLYTCGAAQPYGSKWVLRSAWWVEYGAHSGGPMLLLLVAGGLRRDAQQLQRQPGGHGAGRAVQTRMPGIAAGSASTGASAAPARDPHLDPTPSPLMRTMHRRERRKGIIGCTHM